MSSNKLVEEYNELFDSLFQSGKASKTGVYSQLAKDVAKAYGRLTSANNLRFNVLDTLRYYDEKVKAVSAYQDSKAAVDTDFSKYLLREMLSPWQKSFYDDRERRITLLAGRRSGKSYSIVQKAIKHCIENPPVVNGVEKPRVAYIIGLTYEKTVSLYWQNIKDALQKAHINVKKIDNGTATIIFTNNNTLSLYGNNSKAEREKLRGKDISFVAIDECQSQQGLAYLIDSVLNPMLKGTRGDLILAGTAPLSANTFWERSILSEEWQHFHATMADNPFIPDCDKALQEVLEENHWTEDNITYRREYLGEIAYDDNLLLFPYTNYYENIPVDFIPRYAYVGIDLGWKDKSAIVACLLDDKGQGYVVSEFSEAGCGSSYLLEQCKAVRDSLAKVYKLPLENIHFITDTNEQNMTRDWYNQGLFELENVRKKSVDYSIALVNEAIQTKQLHFKANGPLDMDHKSTVYKWDQERQQVIYEEDKSVYHADAFHALRYAYQHYFEDVLCMQ